MGVLYKAKNTRSDWLKYKVVFYLSLPFAKGYFESEDTSVARATLPMPRRRLHFVVVVVGGRQRKERVLASDVP